MSESKVTAAHLRRAAVVYVRQSTMAQLARNRESTTGQYDLVARGVELGWPRAAVRVIDEDLGVSGASATGRSGFAELAALVRARPGWADRVRLLSVSFDPEHDTPEALARHARSKGATPPLWTYAVAAHDELRGVAGPLGLDYAPLGDGSVLHNLCTAIVGPDGRLARLEVGRATGAWAPAEMLEAMKPLLAPSRK